MKNHTGLDWDTGDTLPGCCQRPDLARGAENLAGMRQ